jgi:hypothetical protein
MRRVELKGKRYLVDYAGFVEIVAASHDKWGPTGSWHWRRLPDQLGPTAEAARDAAGIKFDAQYRYRAELEKATKRKT